MQSPGTGPFFGEKTPRWPRTVDRKHGPVPFRLGSPASKQPGVFGKSLGLLELARTTSRGPPINEAHTDLFILPPSPFSSFPFPPPSSADNTPSPCVTPNEDSLQPAVSRQDFPGNPTPGGSFRSARAGGLVYCRGCRGSHATTLGRASSCDAGTDRAWWWELSWAG